MAKAPPTPAPKAVASPPPVAIAKPKPAVAPVIGRTYQYFESHDDTVPEAAIVTTLDDRAGEGIAATVHVFGRGDLAHRREHSVALEGSPAAARTGRRIRPIA